MLVVLIDIYFCMVEIIVIGIDSVFLVFFRIKFRIMNDSWIRFGFDFNEIFVIF